MDSSQIMSNFCEKLNNNINANDKSMIEHDVSMNVTNNLSVFIKGKGDESKFELDKTGFGGGLGNVSNSNMWDISCIKKK